MVIAWSRIALNMPRPNVKRLVLTTAVVSITIAGTLYGAGLKTKQEITEVRAIPFRLVLSVHLQPCRLTGYLTL